MGDDSIRSPFSTCLFAETFGAIALTTTPAGAGLRFAAALSTAIDTPRAVDEVCSQAAAQLGSTADLAVVFVSHHHGPPFAPLAAEITRRTQAGALLGCTGEAIVGGPREIEEGPAVALWLARLPGATVDPMHLSFERTPEGGTIVGWPDNVPSQWPAGSALLMLAEPFSFPADLLLERLNEDQPGVPVLGGMASGAHGPGENRLLFGHRGLDGNFEHDRGAVAVLLHGAVRVRAVVSQGCRPIGRHFVVTKADKNVILELSGKPALQQLQEIFDTLPDRDKQLVQRGLHVGLVTNEYQDTFQRGDFLVRNCVGADPQAGAIAIGDFVRPGQTVQFHIRDEHTADEDLRELLAAAGRDQGSSTRGSLGGGSSTGALLFTCNGRGTRLFSQPDHDAAAVMAALGDVPLAGFFAQGELGPIGGKNFLHGFTASLALFSADE
jgi:small ligand-binding sensory domain FIST